MFPVNILQTPGRGKGTAQQAEGKFTFGGYRLEYLREAGLVLAVLVALFVGVALQRKLNQLINQRGVFSPLAAQSLGYMLMLVKPGMVFTSFK